MHIPSIRRVQIVVDPALLTNPRFDPRTFPGIPRWTPLKVLGDYLERLGEGVGFELLLPADLLGSQQARLLSIFLPASRTVALSADCQTMPYFEGCTAPRSQLVALANQERAQLVLTEDAVLIQRCAPDLLDPPALAVTWDRMLDVIECQLLGHGIFHSSNDDIQGQWLDTFFQMSHPMNRWLTHVHSSVHGSCDADARELLRSFAFNRYPFILLARALIHFYRWQSLWYKRESVDDLHAFVKTFYLTQIYLLMWGALDHLCLILNRVHAYGFTEKKCGMHNEFLGAIRQRAPLLAGVLDSDKITKFRGILADMRHAAAHRGLLMPTAFLADTDESSVPEEQLRAELGPELDAELPNLPPNLREQLLAQRVQLMRLERMKTLAAGAVYVKRDGGGYIYHPYVSLDHDIDCLNQVIRAFIACCFPNAAQPPEGTTPS